MHHARHGGSHQPGEPNHRVDGNHKRRDTRIVVVRFPMYDLVAGVIDNVPRNAIVQKGQNKRQCRRPRSHKNHPDLAIEVEQIHHPIAASERRVLLGTVIWKVGTARSVAAIERGGKRVGYIEFFRGDTRKEQLFDQRKDHDRNGNGKIGKGAAKGVVTAKGRMLESSQHHGKETRAKAENETQKGHGQKTVMVVLGRRLLLGRMMLMIRIKIMQQPHLTRRIPNRIENKNRNDQKRKNLIRKARRILNEPIQIHEARHDHIERHPQPNPRIQGQKWHIDLFRQFIRHRLKGQHRPRPAIDHHGHARHETVKDTAPGGRQEQFDGPHVIVGAFGVDGAKGNARGNHGNEQKEGDGNGFGIEIGHFGFPVATERGDGVVVNAAAPGCGGVVVVTARGDARVGGGGVLLLLELGGMFGAGKGGAAAAAVRGDVVVVVVFHQWRCSGGIGRG